MSDGTAISWTDATWNPTVGCDQISPGCANCYAKTSHDRRHKARLVGKQLPVQYAEPFEVLQLRPDRLEQPLRWRKPRRIFVNSISDLFHDDVPDAFIDKVFGVMALASWHTFQVLTKRPKRMRAYLSRHDVGLRWLARCYRHGEHRSHRDCWQEKDAVEWTRNGLENVWLGVSVENQHFADERIPLLLQTPASVRFISAEPLLGHINLIGNGLPCEQELLAGGMPNRPKYLGGPFLDWVITGGESGPRHRASKSAWFDSLRMQCKAAGVAFFHKQNGGRTSKSGGCLLDGREYKQFPQSAREV